MGFVEDVQVKEGVLEKHVFIRARFRQPVFYITDSFILEVNTGKALFPGPPDNLFLLDINAFYKIVAFEKCTKQDYPDDYKKDAERIFGKSQRLNPSW